MAEAAPPPPARPTTAERTAHLFTFDEFLRFWADDRPKGTALDGPDRVLNYGELEQVTAQIVGGFMAAGIGKGDRIAWLGKNSTLYFALFFAAARLGAVMVPIGWRLAPAEALWIARDAQAKAVFLGQGFAPVADAFAALPAVKHCFTQDEAWDWIESQARGAFAAAGADDAVLQLYTSGTTGNPKGAVLSNRNLFGLRKQSTGSNLPYTTMTDDEAILVAMPCAHIGGTGLGVMAVGAGLPGIILAEFEPRAVFDAVEQKGVTRFFIVPAALQMLLNHPDCAGVDFSRVKYIIYGASPIPLVLLRECIAMFKADFIQAYGMTETTGTICMLPPEDHCVEGNQRMRSAGKPLPGVEVRIIGEDGAALGANQIGEIQTRSSNNMLGYWNLPEATARTMTADGWIATGDAGYLDEDGYVYMHDRIKDMIISGGENVYPAQVESAIYGHPDVLEVAVIGVPDEIWGEAVKAVCVAKPGHTVAPDSVIKWTRERLAGFKVPKSVDVVDALPRNPSGKILRRALREPYWQGFERQVN
ncbi:MAG: acyl-CoA synthetase [Novosphingobium sp. 28-62-57]|uniref:fatty acid--CoA ligase n=1 Tax=unclassified Novosphingobium TaxID=2644732 RepID=UPI000BC48004|nr:MULTISPECIES: fatty acid--CoA ligase [unclassified Novosphingobium]OYW51001.1 MAG: acyl-CoA synthetase [Novosphingobium sp. 12-62-10]OYZ11177.1 MAG: acyl-CoA synthetase [Novosphingobium sp. 28-62-57]OZA36351.1 MAG: acyl-CoA synthetase [Novosphingobium sp. 17-62-9]HQS69015.1 fatty acid--CoA ligase [Novosphingobium sp.]